MSHLMGHRYPDDNGLRVGRVGKTRTEVPNGFEVSLPRISLSSVYCTQDLFCLYRVARDPRFDRLPCSREHPFSPIHVFERLEAD